MKLRNTFLMAVALLAIAMSAAADPCGATPASGPPPSTGGPGQIIQTLCYGPAALGFTAPTGSGIPINDLFTFTTFDPTTLGAGQVLLGIKITFTADFTATINDVNTTGATPATVIFKLEDHGKLCQPDSDPNVCFAPAFGAGSANNVDDLATLEGFKVEEITIPVGGSVSDSLAVQSPNTSSNVGGEINNGVTFMGANQIHVSQTVTLVGTGPLGLGGVADPFVGDHAQGTGSASPYTYTHTGPPGANGTVNGGTLQYDIGTNEVVVPVNFVPFSTVAGDISTCGSIEATYGLDPTFTCSAGGSTATISSTGQATVTIEYDFGSATPEPGSLMLLGTGLTALGSLIRRKVSKS